MSDPKRATLITVGAPKSAKNNVNKTVRLTINLDESNESKYPELNYKELVIAEEKKKRVVNGKTSGLDPFSDNDDDVERVARKFEQKYGGKSTYGRKGRSKHDDFADIGAGYDENDSFIDNTHGYDEMIPPECDTFYGGFYINCGSLEFKTIPENQTNHSDGEPNRRNKRRISSSSSEESSESSSESSQDEKDTKAANGEVDLHKTEHRKKKNKKIDKQKARKVRRTDSSAATSGKQTSDDNGHGEAESDSRSSQSDSLTSKPAPSSENAATSDSSREVEAKVDVKLPQAVEQALETLEAAVGAARADCSPPAKELLVKMEPHIVRVEAAARAWGSARVARAASVRVTAALGQRRGGHCSTQPSTPVTIAEVPPARTTTANITSTGNASTTTTVVNTTSTSLSNTSTSHNKRTAEDELDHLDIANLTPEQREAMIVETLQRLKALIDERKPEMIANYNAECQRVQEERKKIQIASAAEGGPLVEKRLPKRRFPWCARSRALLARLRALGGGAGAGGGAAALLARRALPLFPRGFVRMPTLLRQADLNKELKAATEVKRQRLGSASQPPAASPVQFTEPIQFPSSLTVTTSSKTSLDKTEAPVTTEDAKVKTSTVKSSVVTSTVKSSSVFESIMNSIPRAFPISKDLIVEKPDKKDDRVNEDLYHPPNNIGSITITPVLNNQKEKKTTINVNDKLSGFLKVKSPAALNEMVKTKDKKKHEKNHIVKEQKLDAPLHVDTSFQTNRKEPSPKLNKDGIVQKKIESMRASENNIPRPGLVPVHHSPTFAKPDKRPPEVKKKKDLLIISDVDPLGDVQHEPVAVDDSSSDVELVEDSKVTDNSEPKLSDKCEVPSKDKTMQAECKKVNSVKISKDRAKDKAPEKDDATNEDIDTLMKNIRDMQQSQEPTEYNSNSYGGVINNAKHEMSSTQQEYERPAMFGAPGSVKDKFTERTSLNKMDGCSVITG